MTQERSNDARDLLEELELSGALNDEKKVLSFCCACCRLICGKLPKIAQDALEVSENYIKNSASVQDLINARVGLWKFIESDYMNFEKPHVPAIRAVICCLYEIKTIDEAFSSACYALDFCNCIEIKTAEHIELLLKIFGNPKN